MAKGRSFSHPLWKIFQAPHATLADCRDHAAVQKETRGEKTLRAYEPIGQGWPREKGWLFVRVVVGFSKPLAESRATTAATSRRWCCKAYMHVKRVKQKDACSTLSLSLSHSVYHLCISKPNFVWVCASRDLLRVFKPKCKPFFWARSRASFICAPIHTFYFVRARASFFTYIYTLCTRVR